MKHSTILLTFLISCSLSAGIDKDSFLKKDFEVLWNELDERDGVIYLANSQTPFTGCFVHYETKKVDFFRGCSVDGKLHGVYEKYWFNGQLKYKQESKHGKLHGPREWYYQNGQLEWREYQRNGEMHGLHAGYEKNGQLEWMICWQNGDIVDRSYCGK